MHAIIFATLLAVVAAKPTSIVSAPVADPAGTFYTRAPAYDSAVIQSDRLGGNFAYSVSEAHAYAAHTPIVQQVHTPVAVSYNSAPAAAAVHTAPVAQQVAPVAYTSAALPASTYYAAAPAANYYNAYYPYNGYPYQYYGR